MGQRLESMISGGFFQHKCFCDSYDVNTTAVVIGKLRLAK